MWVLAHSICLQEVGAESLLTDCSDIELLAQSKSKHIPEKFCSRGSLTEAYLVSLSGTMFVPSEPTTQTQPATLNGCEKGVGNSSSVAGSPNFAKTYQLPAKARGSKVADQDSGKSLPGLLARYDPDTHSLKTVQCSLFEDSIGSCVILPAWGSMRNGEVCLRPTSARGMKGTEPGLWPTPSGVKGKGHCAGVISEWGGSGNPFRGTELRNLHLPTLEEWMMGWPEGWSALTPLETAKYQLWLQQHSES